LRGVVLVDLLEFPGQTSRVSSDVAKSQKQVPAVVQHVFREHILLSIDPQEGKALLGAVENLWEEATLLLGLLLVEHFIGFRKLQSVVFAARDNIQDVVKSLYAN
jgi:hypothetical protein